DVITMPFFMFARWVVSRSLLAVLVACVVVGITAAFYFADILHIARLRPPHLISVFLIMTPLLAGLGVLGARLTAALREWIRQGLAVVLSVLVPALLTVLVLNYALGVSLHPHGLDVSGSLPFVVPPLIGVVLGFIMGFRDMTCAEPGQPG